MPPGRRATLWLVATALVAPDDPGEERTAIEELIHPWSGSIVDTLTPPTGARRIDVSRWEDLLHAAELLGRPILRLHGGEGGPDGRLFYVADGPQSYVFGFTGAPVNVAKSGGFASAPAPRPATSPPAPERPAPAPSPGTVLPPPPALAPPPVRSRPIPPPVVPDPADALLGPELPGDRGPDTDLPSATVVERRIREMIHELLDDFRQLPPSSDRLERGTEHIQRAVDMLHLGRYGVAQIELNKAARLLREDPGH